MSISVPVSWGELIDKITILEIKLEMITGPDARANVSTEHDALSRVVQEAGIGNQELPELKAALLDVNKELWKIEDDIRDCERNKDFGDTFIALARAVYRTNDRRAALKREINTLLGSELFEEKSYREY